MNEQSTRGRQPFDSTVCFTCFGGWVESIYKLAENGKLNTAFNLFKTIADYCLYGIQPNFDDMGEDGIYIEMIWPTIEAQANNSIKNRRARFDLEKPTEIQQRIIEELARNPDASNREVGYLLSVGKSTVDVTRKKYQDLIAQKVKELEERQRGVSYKQGDTASEDTPYNQDGCTNLDDELPF